MASDTGGVKPFSIQGRLARERERVMGMTNEERAWRRQWVKDQELSPNEPRHVPEYFKERYNPIRRAYRMPLDMAFKPLMPVLGERRTNIIRWFTGKFLMIGFAIYAGAYYFKYNANMEIYYSFVINLDDTDTDELSGGVESKFEEEENAATGNSWSFEGVSTIINEGRERW
ncbi:hypothetical protein ANN_01919 [Periplaneta americana]|uniref:Complex I-B17 n=1 Tax=Periplaneta americana TaxID=6978 RepID=A0ABQ8TUU8_PERAM|nr:hypothetical protein ANN_01919 [Periplaneta americana]